MFHGVVIPKVEKVYNVSALDVCYVVYYFFIFIFLVECQNA